MVSEFRVMQGFQRVFHVFSVAKLNFATAILVHIRVDDISGLAHKVFQVLPTAAARQVGYFHAEFTAFCARLAGSIEAICED